MPRVGAFYGVVIYMYWNERDHPVAHFHAYHAGQLASISADGEVLAGRMEPRALQLVREWARLRQNGAVPRIAASQRLNVSSITSCRNGLPFDDPACLASQRKLNQRF